MAERDPAMPKDTHLRRAADETRQRAGVQRELNVKIYTKTGDEGITGLLGNQRVPKDDVRIDAYGTVDELNAVLGTARAQALDSVTDQIVAQLQDELFAVGSALADPDPDGRFHHAIKAENATRLEGIIDALETELPPLTNFILPGGCVPAAQLHLARTVCRRAERLVVKLARQPGGTVSPALIIYLNRLSDLLFVLARVANHRARVSDIPWKGL
jgi:cob(I)alamin adenosyltransferase